MSDAKRSGYETERTRNGAEARSAGKGPFFRIRSGGIRSSGARSGVKLRLVDGAEVKLAGLDT